MIKALTTAAIAATTFIGMAMAAPTTFTLDAVAFGPPDGTSVTGSFVFDPQTGEFGDVAVTTQAGDTGAVISYTVAADGTGDLFSGFQFFQFQTEETLGAGSTLLELVVFDMVAETGTFALQFVSEAVCQNDACDTLFEIRAGDTGALVATAPVPLPAAALLLPFGLAGLFGARRLS